MAVRAGRYRNRIQIVKDAEKRNKYGGSTNERVVVQAPWCKTEVISNNENSGTKDVSQLIIEFEMRYSKSLENPEGDMYILFKGQEFDIISVINPYELNEKLKIMGKRRR